MRLDLSTVCTVFSLAALSVGLLASCPGAFGQNQQNAQPTTRRGYVASAALPPEEPAANDSYPHITTLEKAILGQTYVGQALKDRLARMETKAFGKPSSSADLSERTDQLEDYSQKTLHQRAFGAGSAAETDQTESIERAAVDRGVPDGDGPPLAHTEAPAAEAGQGESEPATQYPHITNLEKEILGQTFPGQPLPDRIARLETKAFGKPSTIDDYSERTDALEAYAQKKLHAKPFVQEQQKEAQAYGGGPSQGNQSSGGGSSTQSKLLSIVGNSLLSMAGVNRMGMFPMMGGNPALGNGMGGGIMPGFGGVRARPKQAADQPQQQAAVDTHPEDPAIYAAAAPPAEAKMLTKVGWCEVQLFGHPFANLHLPARLQQLSKELNYKPGKSAIELMDDVGGLVKAVQLKKQTTTTVTGSTPAGAAPAAGAAPTNAAAANAAPVKSAPVRSGAAGATGQSAKGGNVVSH